LPIVAMDCDDELQLTKVVSTCVALSENVPMAVNCSVAPRIYSNLPRYPERCDRRRGYREGGGAGDAS